MYSCECGKNFEKKSSLNSHARFCNQYIKKEKPISKYKKEKNLYECECGETFDNHQKLNSHFPYCLIHRNGTPPINSSRSVFLNGKRGWSKGLSKEDNEGIQKRSKTLSENLKSGKIPNPFKGKHISERTREILSLKQSGENYSGGICQWYTYIKPDNSIQRVQGTWELKFASYLDIIDKDWIKPGIGKNNHTYIWYDKKGIKRRYTPDFWCPNLNKYFEVKGYWRESDRIKMKSVFEQNIDLKIEIIEKKQMVELKLI